MLTNNKFYFYFYVFFCYQLLEELQASLFGPICRPQFFCLIIGDLITDVMAVQWATIDQFCSAGTFVRYGTSATALTEVVQGECFKFSLPAMFKQSNHLAYIKNLKASTKYYYSVGDSLDNGAWSDVYFFTTAPDASTVSAAPQKFLIFGDLAASSSAPDKSSTIMPFASAEVANGAFDMILHLGDFAYDFQSKGEISQE